MAHSGVALRARWARRPQSLAFVDEMGTRTSRAPSYGYSPRGQGAFFKVPRNRGTNTTLLSSMSSDGIRTSVAIEGSMTKEAFEACVEHFLAPTWLPRQGRGRWW